MPVGFCVGLLLFPADSGQSRARTLLDGMIVAGSLFLVSWVTILSPIYSAGSDSAPAMIISLAYPLSDVVVLTIAALAWLRAADDQRRVLNALTMAMVFIAVADSGFFAYLTAKNAYSSGSVIDAGWVAGLLLIMVAATSSRDEIRLPKARADVTSWASVWFPYAPAASGRHRRRRRAGDRFPDSAGGDRGNAADAGSTGPPVPGGDGESPAAGNRRRTGAAGPAHRPGQPRDVLRPSRGGDATTGARPWVGGADHLGPQRFQARQRRSGHPAGDELLNRAGERILGCVRNSDTVARLGGDEFVVLIDDDTLREHADQIAQRIAESFDKPFTIEGQELFIRPSVGLAVAGPGEPAVTAEDLVKRADTAMYAAKKTRTPGVQRYTHELHLDTSADNGLIQRLHSAPSPEDAASKQLLGELREAIDSVELTLAYQQVQPHHRPHGGRRSLIRWPHHRRGLLSPDEFLPLVRHHGLMRPVTDLVINTALDAALGWHQAAVHLPVAVNMSAPLLADPPHLPPESADRWPIAICRPVR